ncbi:MAG: UvrD-helicase domain-containing protein, partial [Dissulfurispiraceae bacterium]
FCKLRQGDVDEAVKSIDFYTESLKCLEEIAVVQDGSLKPGENLVDLSTLDPTLLEHYMKSASFKQWMLYLHPDQQGMVDKDFPGPVKLVGVSGSGKTSVVVKRAIRLAQNYSDQQILVLTLNKSLARLIEELISQACPDSFRKNIVVSSFWEFCQDKLKEIEPGGSNGYGELTWKTNEHIDEIWDDFFECRNNNDNAKVLMPVNKSLLARRVFPKDYLKQEFDWIRSALPKTDRNKYLEIDRQGRVEALSKDYRGLVLEALGAWEDKMGTVGATDYLGVANALHRHLDELQPGYRCVLVDEVQDFGTTELQIIRKLVAKEANDVFLCGDIAQQVYTKHRKLKQADIDVSGRSFVIKKNYRNSREILAAAYAVLSSNIDPNKLDTEDFEILEPEYANFSTPMPLLLRAEGIDEELGRAYYYLTNTLDDGQKGCICLCGYSLVDVKAIGDKIGLQVLDGNVNIEGNTIFLSDLYQAKGFEFDTVCIINCTKSVIPDPIAPSEEWYRDICKFYVAMTRAKLSLILSYSGLPSDMFIKSDEYFNKSEWKTHEEKYEINGFSVPLPMKRRNEEISSFLNMTGEEFLYTRKAVGVSKDLSDKLSMLITGKNETRTTFDGTVLPREWKNIAEALGEPRITSLKQRFGSQKLYDEFINLFPEAVVQIRGFRRTNRPTVQPMPYQWQVWHALAEWTTSEMKIYLGWAPFAEQIAAGLQNGRALSEKDKQKMKQCWAQAMKHSFRY